MGGGAEVREDLAEPEIDSRGITARLPVGQVGESAGVLAEGADRLASKLQEADDNEQITMGSLKVLGGLENTIRGIQQDNDWRNAGTRFSQAVITQQQEINSSDMPGNVKTALLEHLGTYSVTRGHDLAGWAYTQNIESKKTNLENSLQQLVNLGAQAGPKQRDVIFQQAMQAIEGNRGSVLPDDVADKLKKVTAQTFDYSAAMTDLMKDPKTTAARLKDFTQYANINPDQRAELQIHANREANVQQEALKGELSDRLDDAIHSAAMYGTFDKSIIPMISAAGDGKFESQAQKRLSMAMDVYDVTTRMQEYDPDKRAELLQSLAPKPGQEGFAQQEELYDIAVKKNEQINKAVANDPASLVAGRINPTLPLGEQVLQSMNLQRAMGVPNPKPLSNAQQDQLAQEYIAAPADSKQTLMMSWRGQLGNDAYDAAMRQLYTKLPPSAMFADQVNPDTMKHLAALDIISLSMARSAVGEADAKSIKKGVETQFGQIAQAMPGNAPQQSMLRDTFEKLALDFQHSGDPDPVGHANRELFGSYTFQGTWMAPAGTDMGKLRDYGNHVIQNIQGFHGLNDPYAETLARSTLAASNRWQYDPSGRYYLLDSNSQPVFDNNDQPVSFTLPAAMMWQKPEQQVPQGTHVGGTRFNQ